MTKHLLRNSSGLQAVLCVIRIKSAILFQQVCIHQSHCSQSKFWVQDFTKTCGWTTNTKWSFFMQFISDLSKDITRLAQQEPFLMVTRLHIPAWFLFLWHNSSPQIPHNLFFSCTLSESLPWLSFFFEKRKEKWKSHWLDISMTVFLQRPLQFQLKLTSSR